MADEKRTAADDEGACFQLHQFCEDFIEVAFTARIQDMDLQPESAGGPKTSLAVAFAIVGSAGLTRSAMTRAVGKSWCSNSSRF